MKKRIDAIATVGPIGSGKDTVIEYISKKYRIPMISIGDIAVDMARCEGIDPTRDNLHMLTERTIKRCGQQFFSKEVLRRAANSGWKSLAVAGLRYPEDVAMLRRLCRRLVVVFVRTSKPEVRFERLRRRKEPRDPRTFQEFVAQDGKEIRMFNLEKTFEMSDFVIENDGTLKELYQEADALIGEVFQNPGATKNMRVRN